MQNDSAVANASTHSTYLAAMGLAHGRRAFEGMVRVISVSSIGEVDGLVLEDGSFVQIPPHSLVDGLNLKVGDFVTGDGELILDKPHGVYRGATVFKEQVMIANNNLADAEREPLIERHRHAQKNLAQRLGDELPHQKLEDISGTLMAVSIKSIGEIDRLIFENQASVHLPESLHLALGDIEIGEFMTVRGRISKYGEASYVLAERITSEDGLVYRSNL